MARKVNEPRVGGVLLKTEISYDDSTDLNWKENGSFQWELWDIIYNNNILVMIQHTGCQQQRTQGVECLRVSGMASAKRNLRQWM